MGAHTGLESDHALNEHFAATPSIPNLADGKNHTVKIKYWPTLVQGHDGVYNRTNFKKRGAIHTANIATCGDCEDTNTPTKFAAPDDCYKCNIRNSAPGNLAVFIDDMKRPVLQTAISLRKSINNDGASATTPTGTAASWTRSATLTSASPRRPVASALVAASMTAPTSPLAPRLLPPRPPLWWPRPTRCSVPRRTTRSSAGSSATTSDASRSKRAFVMPTTRRPRGPLGASNPRRAKR